jgi:outer membrane protein OmpA-like peptidoglycan-associated protein
MFDDIDEGARVGVWTTLGIITMLLFGLLGGLGVRSLHLKATAPSAPMAAAATDALLDGPIAGELAGTLYFAVGAAALPADAEGELVKAKAAADAATGKKLVLSGFHDASGDPAKNAELAKQRALAVRAALQAAGVAPERIALRKPESTTGKGQADQARRVEIRLVD